MKTSIKSETEITGAQGPQVSIRNIATSTAKQSTRTRLPPDRNACGPHTVFTRNGTTGKVNHYETYIPQTNLRNPNPWQSIGRFDNSGNLGHSHYNKVLGKEIYEPHVHDPLYPGGIRAAEAWEIPKGKL